jgi:hypothetical protein
MNVCGVILSHILAAKMLRVTGTSSDGWCSGAVSLYVIQWPYINSSCDDVSVRMGVIIDETCKG